MNDIQLTTDHDISIEDGNFKLLDDEAKVAQQTLKINLLFFEGEWFLDNTYGIPYFQEILGKVSNTNLVDTIIQETVRESYNIDRITSFSSSISPDRVYSVDLLEAITEDGEIISITNLQV